MKILTETRTDNGYSQECRTLTFASEAEAILAYYLVQAIESKNSRPSGVQFDLSLDGQVIALKAHGHHQVQLANHLDNIVQQLLEKLDPVLCKAIRDIAFEQAKRYCGQELGLMEDRTKRLDLRLHALEKKTGASEELTKELDGELDDLEQRLAIIEKAITENDLSKEKQQSLAWSVLTKFFTTRPNGDTYL